MTVRQGPLRDEPVFGKPPDRNSGRSRVLDKSELRKLQEFLRNSFGAPGIKVGLDPKNEEQAVVSFGERAIGVISVDDEDGDRSFSFAMKIPVERAVLQDYLRRLFDNDDLKIASRMKKTDSVELNRGEDFLGVVSSDDPKGKSFTLQMAILDYDLDEL